MRFQHIYQAVYGQPWQITPAGWYAIHQIVQAHAGPKADLARLEEHAGRDAGDPRDPKPRAARPAKGFFGDPIQQMTMVNGIARIPMKGSLVKGAGMLDKVCGAVSHEDIHEDLDTAVGSGCRGIILDTDCPGGMVMGTPELASRIASIVAGGTEVQGFIDGLGCSAAIYILAGCSGIYATPSSMVGSVGTIWEFCNVVKQLEELGIHYDIFASGPYKGLGHPAQELTDDQAAWIQEHVDMLSEEFKNHMRQHRPGVAEETMQGQVFTGAQGAENGLIDATVSGIQEVYDLFGEA